MDERPLRTRRSRWWRFVWSFYFAGRGLVRLVASEPNAQFHLVATVAVAAVGFWLTLSSLEWAVIVIAIGLVWTTEGLNSALESLADRVSPEQDPLIERAKDVAAGAVLVAAIG